MIVLDASVTLSWLLPDESTQLTERVIGRLQHDEALVPHFWLLEVVNTLLVAERRGRVTEANMTYLVESLRDIPISFAPPVALSDVPTLLVLGREHGLSAYDAAYLAVAMKEGIPLATGDGRLRSAALAAGVECL